MVPIVMVLSLPLALVGPLLAQASWIPIFPVQAFVRYRAGAVGSGEPV